jgi:hypothetical protein
MAEDKKKHNNARTTYSHAWADKRDCKVSKYFRQIREREREWPIETRGIAGGFEDAHWWQRVKYY